MLDRVDPELEKRFQKLGNVQWDLSRELYRSYRLLRSCKIVFGRHTSLMDEARALGIPVVVHENFCHSLPWDQTMLKSAARLSLSNARVDIQV